jgi:hypothetical protein
MEIRIVIPDISLNTQEFLSIGLSTEYVTYIRRYLRHAIHSALCKQLLQPFKLVALFRMSAVPRIVASFLRSILLTHYHVMDRLKIDHLFNKSFKMFR